VPNIILGCTMWTVIFYAITMAMGLGWWPVETDTHRLAGLFTAVFSLAVQGFAFTLGIAWSRIILEAAKAGVLPQELATPARAAMMRIDAFAMVAMTAVITAAVMGGALGASSLTAAAHGWGAGIAWLAMMTAYHFQYRDFCNLSELFKQAQSKLEAAAQQAAAADES
jgi:hypothetical protein